MQSLRLSLLFNRWDVDAFLDEIPNDLFDEWCNFLALEPQGWQAQNLVAQRLGFLAAQTHSAKRLNYRDFTIQMAHEPSIECQHAQHEAMAIQSQVRDKIEALKASRRAARKQKADATPAEQKRSGRRATPRTTKVSHG